MRVAKWKWIDQEWKPVVKPHETDAEGWVYTDNTWKNPGPVEAFGKYTVLHLIAGFDSSDAENSCGYLNSRRR